MVRASLMNRALRALYRGVLWRRAPLENDDEQRRRILENSYSTFSKLSQKSEIDNILFANGKSVINLRDGRRYHFDARDSVARMYSVPDTGTFEAKETEFVRGFIQPGQVCFDIGASFGWYTILFSKLVGPSGNVHAFEPIPHTFEVLKGNVDLNECCNVTLNNVALDATNGRQDLFLPDIGVSGSFRLHAYKETYQVINWATRTLDDYCLQNGVGHVDFIKADIEGAEWLMLQGAKVTLERSRPVLFLEIQRTSTKLFGYEPNELFEFLAGWNYTPHFVSGTGSLVRVDDYHGPLPDHNFIFLSQEEV